MAVALLFPGQGSQVAGMRDLVADARPDLLELAIALAGADPFELIEEGTRYAQPALCATSLALWSAAGEPAGDAVAGHSLGEVAALAAAGALAAEDAVRIAAERGALMQEAAASGPRGAMIALLGEGEVVAELAAALARDRGLTVANDNAPGQLVLSGPAEAVDGAEAQAAARGVRSVRLRVQGAFHSAAMAPAVGAFRAFLEGVAFRRPRVPLFSCSRAAPAPEDLRGELAAALTRPVRWRETLAALRGAGIETFVDVGPGKVLKGLARRALPGCEALTLAELEAAHA